MKTLWTTTVQCDRSVILDQCRALREEDRRTLSSTYQGLHRFSQRFRILPGRPLATRVDAEAAVREQFQDNIAVAACYFVNQTASVQAKRILARKEKVDQAITALAARVASSLKDSAGGSGLVRCRSCRSLVSRRHLKNASCPVCEELLLTTAQKARLVQLQADRQALEEAAGKLPTVPDLMGPVMWLVGGLLETDDEQETS